MDVIVKFRLPLNKRAVVAPSSVLESAPCETIFASSATILTGEPMQVQPERKIVRRFADPKLASPKLTAFHAPGIEIPARNAAAIFPVIL